MKTVMTRIAALLISHFFLLVATLPAQSPVLNEVMPSNLSTIADEDSDFSDWLEIYNDNSLPINLSGFALSDDTTRLDKWLFPQLELQPQQHMLIFASGKDRRKWVNHWETIIDRGELWRYRLGSSEPPSTWRELTYDDSQWTQGKSGFGYGDGDDATIVPATLSLYIRKSFHISDLTKVITAVLHVDYDDGFVACLNGVEIARVNIGTPGIPPAYNQTADQASEAQIYQGGKPASFVVKDAQTILRPGNNVLAIQVHNVSSSSSDLTLIPFFTLGMAEPPAVPYGKPDILSVEQLQLHTNFKLDANGETITLADSLGQIIDRLTFTTMTSGVSYGRQPDGSNHWQYFQTATPGQANTVPGYPGIATEPLFSLAGGFYSTGLQLTLSTDQQDATIRYTLDGSEPTESSLLYSTPITIQNTTVVRARAFCDSFIASKMVTQTYFINENFTLPVVAIATTPANLWDETTGIYVFGPTYESSFPYFGANFWQEWESPIHIEFFTPDGDLGFSEDAGIKIFGGWSRAFAQRSFGIHFRRQYGTDEIDYQLFPDKPITKFNSFVLRNSGNDWEYTLFRDGLMQTLVKDTGLEVQAYRPVIVFLNGEYWGILNMREKIDEHYLASNCSVDPDSVDLLESNCYVLQGSADHYLAMLDYIAAHDLSDPAAYNYVTTQMDVNNFIDYEVAQIYFNNGDWPGNNIRFWRPQRADGKWRWLLYDTDFGFGLYDASGYTQNTLVFATEPNGPDWPNPPWSTFLLRSLLQNQSFQNDFINRFADRLNSIYLAEQVTAKINEMKNGIAAEMPRHFAKWGRSVTDWQQKVQVLLTFAKYRSAYVRTHLINYFHLDGLSRLTLQVAPEDGGTIRINSLAPTQYPWNGQYFRNVPLQLTAIVRPGYRFSGWSGSITGNNPKSELMMSSECTVTARFELKEDGGDSIVINEMNYNSNPAFNPEDWLELHNRSNRCVHLSNWVLKDSNDAHSLVLPQSTQISAGSYLVICKDTTEFKKLFPSVNSFLGNFTFGFSSSGELIRLFDAENNLVDSVRYDDQSPWPPDANGSGATLALKNPELDNSLPENWTVSANHGTPGQINDIYQGVQDGTETTALPARFELEQNYPNPFNSATIIRFSLPHSATVKIVLLDLNGRLIAELVNNRFAAGKHQITWCGADLFGKILPSGVYFYQIQAGSFIQTRKLIHLR